jgi:hypothetical protein
VSGIGNREIAASVRTCVSGPGGGRFFLTCSVLMSHIDESQSRMFGAFREEARPTMSALMNPVLYCHPVFGGRSRV